MNLYYVIVHNNITKTSKKLSHFYLDFFTVILYNYKQAADTAYYKKERKILK